MSRFRTGRTCTPGPLSAGGKMAVLIKIFLVLFFGYLLITLFLFLQQDKMVYFPSKEMTASPADIRMAFKEVIFTTSDELKLHGWLAGEETGKGSRGVLLFCHGNAGNISHRLESISIFYRLGLNVFIFDYRGYGKSEGKPTEQGTYLDIEAAWNYLTETEGIAPERIIIFGRSLGGAVAAYLAASKDINARALILESTFTSVPDLGQQQYPIFPIRLLSHFEYNTMERLRKVKIPVLVIHSPNDEIIPYKHGVALFEVANEPKQFVQIHGSHNEGFRESIEEYIVGLRSFLREY